MSDGTWIPPKVSVRRTRNPSDSYNRIALVLLADVCRNGVSPRARIPWAIAVPAHPKVLAGTYGCS